MKHKCAFLILSTFLVNCGDGDIGDLSDCQQSKGLYVKVASFTGEVLCDAVVEAVDGSFESQLEANGSGDSCFFSLGPRPGDYEVSAAKNDYEKATAEVAVDGDENGCAVERVDLTLKLNPM